MIAIGCSFLKASTAPRANMPRESQKPAENRHSHRQECCTDKPYHSRTQTVHHTVNSTALAKLFVELRYDQNYHKGRQDNSECSTDSPEHAAGANADEGRHIDRKRPRCAFADGNEVHYLSLCEPAVPLDLALYQREHRIPSTERERPDLQKGKEQFNPYHRSAPF